jgi:SAM-dependent methyltransferase
MEREQYELMAREEGRHWWYVGMRRVSAGLLDRYGPSGGRLEVLDAGCGSGGTTAYLGRYGRVTGVDLAAEATALARRRGVGRVMRGSVSELPFRSGSFDLATSFDVLYHLGVADDEAALSELHRVLRPDGVLLIRLPAYDRIRGSHDRAVHTRHRYTREELGWKLARAGFRVEHATYANSLLLPVAELKRLLERGRGDRPRNREHEREYGRQEGATGGVGDLWRPPARR